MKASLVLTALIILSSLSIHAQENDIPDFFVTNVNFLDNDPILDAEAVFVDQTETVLWKTASNQDQSTLTSVKSTSDILSLDTSETVGGINDAQQGSIVNELDYHNFYETNDYKYFLKEGGLKLSF